MADGISFYGIERIERGPDWTRADDSQRAGRWLKPSEYHRLIRREQVLTRAAFLGALTPIAVAGLAYLLG